MSKLADWLEKYRVVIGCITTVLLLAVGGLLVWIDWHPPATQAVSTTSVVKKSSETVPGETKTTSEIIKTASVGESQSPQSGLININSAVAKELDSLPGIGPTYASRIVEYRTVNGAFGSTRDIVKVKGIGEATYAKIKDKITVGGK